ncbi:ATPase PAAT [Conger conger]|uniref:ATPase PAAT n=1 Tax=Conger conger TaxID=82655 RepID=UPI002A5AEF3E|nr:ATPase PAAT [Conger conger]
MTTQNVSFGKDRLVSVHGPWDCKSSERKLGDIVYPVTTSSLANLTQVYTENSGEIDLVYLEQDAEASPCMLRLECAPHSSALISSLLVVTEARTMEVYSGAGEYCGTCRGERHDTLQLENAAEGISLYKKYVQLESPLASCDVKLLSLGGRARVGIGGVVLGLRDDGPAGGTQVPGQAIDLHQVQSMVESIGTTLSPGAQNLMDMVQFQQKNKADALGGFLPLLLGSGPLAVMAKATIESRTCSADAQTLTAAVHGHADASSPGQSLEPESAVAGPNTLPQPLGTAAPDRHDRRLTNAVSSLLNGHPGRRPFGFGPDLLPVLQGVCGQVAQLRIEDGPSATATSAGTEEGHSCCHSLELRLERRMEEMEERLKQHIDRRLDALQQGLERALLEALPLAHLPQGIKGPSVAPPDCHSKHGLLNGDA